MDFIRSAIESVFYHLPIEAVASDIFRSKAASGKVLVDRIVEIVYREKKSFSSSEIKLLGKIILTNWLTDTEMKFTSLDITYFSKWDLLARLPLLLNIFSREVLSCDACNFPVVKYVNLLRWREMSLYVGEDLLTIPFLARLDFSRGIKSRPFHWPNVLEHDNFRLNAVLDNELSDTHSHVNAAQDVFEFNWLAMMNYTSAFLSDSESGFRANGYMMEYDATRRYSHVNLTIREWLMIASGIRLYLFRLNNLKDFPRIDDVNIPSPYIEDADLRKAVENKKFGELLIRKIETLCGTFSENALKVEDSLTLDYAIRMKDFFNMDGIQNDSHKNGIPLSPYLVHHGERSILYYWFWKYYAGDVEIRNSAPVMMLYLLIKCKIRREFIQTNRLVGFENFQTYQSKKLFGLDKISTIPFLSDEYKRLYKKTIFRYAVQSSIGNFPRHYLEARVVPEQIHELIQIDLSKSIFTNENFLNQEDLKYVTIVAHFIKTHKENSDAVIRNDELREKLWNQAHLLVDVIKHGNKSSHPAFVGIDAASSELACRPEVFAPMFRFIRFNGLPNFTFHAGEDFYDILDGLRTIYETINFMGYRFGNRIGHGLALGLDSKYYYSSRHYVLFLPRQVLIDNLVWMKYFAAERNIQLSPNTLLLIEEQFTKQISELGYTRINGYNGNMWEYWQSMLMRGDFVESVPSGRKPYVSDVMYSSVSPALHNSEKDCVIAMLHDFYERNKATRMKGEDPEMVTVPKSFPDDVAKLQQEMLNFLESEGIVIETNPSSNIKIGRFDRYDKHPITLFHNVLGDSAHHAMVVTINTDDKGVFATSLKNEFSLMALALQKQCDTDGKRLWSDLQIENYIKRIAHYGNISRFKI